MNTQIKKISWSAVSTLVAVGTSMLIKKALTGGWEKTQKKKPPKSPKDSDVNWTEAVAWAVISGVLVSIAKLITTKLSEDGWEKLLGENPGDY